MVYGKQYGNIFIKVQSTFGYEDDPMRLLFSKFGSAHHEFAACYSVEKIFKADAILHVGTHGSLEFMLGKQVGMSYVCYPESLIGNIPNVYYYGENNKELAQASTLHYLLYFVYDSGKIWRIPGNVVKNNKWDAVIRPSCFKGVSRNWEFDN